MEVTIQTIVSVLSAVSALIVLAIARNALPKYLEAKSANLATKEDIAAITREQKGVEEEFNRRLEDLRGEWGTRHELLRATLTSQRFWEEEYQRLVVTKVDALLTSYADVLRWTGLIERERFAKDADLNVADREFVEAILGMSTNVQILGRMSVIAPSTEQQMLLACREHRDSWDAILVLIEEARRHHWGPARSADSFQLYEASLGDGAKALRKSADALDRVVVDVGKALVARRSGGVADGGRSANLSAG